MTPSAGMFANGPTWLTPPALERFAFALAVGSLFLATLGSRTPRRSVHRSTSKSHHAGSGRPVPWHAALFLGVAAAIPLCFLLLARAVTMSVDLLRPTPPSVSGWAMELGVVGLVAWLTLCGASFVGLMAARDSRLVTCLFCGAAAALSWATLRQPIFEQTTLGALSRTSVTILWTAGCSVLCVAAAWLTAAVETRRRWRMIGEGSLTIAEEFPFPAGLRIALAAVCLLVALSACHHLVAPEPGGALGFRGSAAAMAIASTAACVAGWHVLLRAWSQLLLDAIMALIPPVFAGASLVFLAEEPANMQERYPRMFNAMIVGLGGATGWLAFLSLVWRDQIGPEGSWSTEGRLSRVLPRFAFMNGALGLIVAALMALWPRVTGVSTPDDSLGRMTAGLAGNLWLVLVFMWCSRRLRRPTFHALVLLALLTTAGFVIVRIMPYSSYAT